MMHCQSGLSSWHMSLIFCERKKRSENFFFDFQKNLPMSCWFQLSQPPKMPDWNFVSCLAAWVHRTESFLVSRNAWVRITPIRRSNLSCRRQKVIFWEKLVQVKWDQTWNWWCQYFGSRQSCSDTTWAMHCVSIHHSSPKHSAGLCVHLEGNLLWV